MKLNVTLRDFTDFSSAPGRGVDSTEIATFLGGRLVSLGDNRAGGNAACSVGKRSDDAKKRNDVTRAALICALLRAFTFDGIKSERAIKSIEDNADTGNWNISEDVLDAIANKLGSGKDGLSKKDFNCGKPLTARRIEKIMAAAVRAHLLVDDQIDNAQDSLNVARDEIIQHEDADPMSAPYLVANTYLGNCRAATDIDGFLANASMAFALCDEEGLDNMVFEISELCGSKFDKKLDEIAKYAEKVDKDDADKTGFSKLRVIVKAREKSHDILMNILIKGKKLAKDYEIEEAPMPRAGVNKITEYANEAVKKTFVSKFAGKEFAAINLAPEEDPFTRKDTQKGYLYSILIGDNDDINTATGGLFFKKDGGRGMEIKIGDDVVKMEKVNENAEPKKASSWKVKGKVDPDKKVDPNKVNDDNLKDEEKKYYKTIADKLITYFTINGVLQKASLAKFLVLAHQGIISATQPAAVYRRTPADNRVADYANTMGVIPVAVSSSQFKSASRQLCLTKKNNGDITLDFSEELMGKRGDRSSIDPAYDAMREGVSEAYNPELQMGYLKHNVKVSFKFSNALDEDTKVLSATASAKYFADEKKFLVAGNPVVEGANNNE